MKKISIPIFRHNNGKDLPLPSYATEESAGMDLYAAISGTITIPPQGRERISTGISIALPYRPVSKRKSAVVPDWRGKKALSC